jgi:hypothetical protein
MVAAQPNICVYIYTHVHVQTLQNVLTHGQSVVLLSYGWPNLSNIINTNKDMFISIKTYQHIYGFMGGLTLQTRLKL